MSDAAPIDRVIAGRRTHKRFDGSPVPRDVLERLLALAVLAPNHRLSNPWRFAVLDRDAIARLGRWLPAQQAVAAVPDPDKGRAKVAKLVEHYFPQLGAMIQVVHVRDDDPHVDREELAATAAACQNLLLAAEARGLATFWASSPALRHPETLRWCGFDPGREVFVGSLWLGGRVADPPRPPREALDAVVRWL